MKVVIAIPARLESTRLPRKLVEDLNGRPVIAHTIEKALQVQGVDEVLVVLDSQEVMDIVQKMGVRGIMTDPARTSGTDRIASALDQIEGDFIINIQGDEPFVDPKLLENLIAAWKKDPVDLITPVYKIKDLKKIHTASAVKVVRAHNGDALYFSRSAIPHIRNYPPEEWLDKHTFWGHIGIYGFARHTLEAYLTLPLSLLDQAESLEQLRFLEAGYRIRTMETEGRGLAIDTAADLAQAREYIKTQC